jgi:hypothetical protein
MSTVQTNLMGESHSVLRIQGMAFQGFKFQTMSRDIVIDSPFP